MARGEIHVELSVNYADDDKLADVSRSARLLYVDALCLAKRVLNDGVMTEKQAIRLCHPDSEKNARKAIDELVESGAWEKAGKNYRIPSWLRRNKSKAQVLQAQAEASEAGTRGNHERWHKDHVSPDCPLCPPMIAPPDPDAIGSASGHPMASGNGGESDSIAIDRDRDRDKDKKEPPRIDVEQTCTRLAEWIERNGSKKPTITQGWRDAARLMLDRDGRTLDESLRLIDWCQRHEFWRTVILSMPKFREKYDQMRLQAVAQSQPQERQRVSGVFER